jgi:hypothetical protein
LDNPDLLLSSEFDIIYVCQAEQLTEADWETIGTRCTGRGSVVAHPQIFGDCNPAGTNHWIPRRAKEGRLTLINTTHKDNPALYDDAGNMTPDGKIRLDNLKNSLSGVRYKRLVEGLWSTAEGAVYDLFNPTIDGPHVRERDDSEFVHWYLAMDEGFTNPQTCLLVGMDSDRRLHVAREFYVTGMLESDIVAQALGWYREKACTMVVVDKAAPSLIAALVNAGMNATGGDKGLINNGIRKMQDRLKVQADGRSRLTVDPSCVNTISEFESYPWQPGKDIPYDRDNHAIGGLRYLVNTLEQEDPIKNVEREKAKTNFYKEALRRQNLRRAGYR